MKTLSQGESYRWARTLLGALQHLGLYHVVVTPGSRSSPLIAAGQDLGLRLLSVYDERGAGFLALGVARATHRAVAVVTTSGSAGGHLLPAVMEADTSRIPLLLLTADRPPERVDAGASQTTDQTRLFEGFLRKRILLPPPGSVPLEVLTRFASQAWHAAHRRPSGPVHLNVPLRKPLEPPMSMPEEASMPFPSVSPSYLLPPQVEVDLDALLSQTPRTVVLVGEPVDGVVRRWLDRIRRHVPVWASPLSGLEDAWGGYPWLAHHPDRDRWIPDGVIQIGVLPLDRAFLAWVESTWHPRHWIQLGIDGRWVDPFHRTTLWIPEGLPPLPERETAWNLQSVEQAFASTLRPYLARQEGVWGALYRVLTLTRGIWFHVGASLAIRDLEWVAGGIQRPPKVWMNRGLNGIDGLIATAVGEALGKGTGILWVGDVAFLHDMGSLLLLRQLRPPLLVIVVNNQGGRIFEELPIAQFPERLPFMVMPHDVDLAGVAASLGIPACRVRTPEELLDAVGKQMANLPAVVEFIVDPEEERGRREAFFQAVKNVKLEDS